MSYRERKVVYIASPYTAPTEEEKLANVHRQIRAGRLCQQFGLVPILPLLAHFREQLFPADYEVWMTEDLELLFRSDVMWRLPGASRGADREEEFAKQLGIPVVFADENSALDAGVAFRRIGVQL